MGGFENRITSVSKRAVSADQEVQGHEEQTDHDLQHNICLLPQVTSVEGSKPRRRESTQACKLRERIESSMKGCPIPPVRDSMSCSRPRKTAPGLSMRRFHLTAEAYPPLAVISFARAGSSCSDIVFCEG
jgi:hypothetical protein